MTSGSRGGDRCCWAGYGFTIPRQNTRPVFIPSICNVRHEVLLFDLAGAAPLVRIGSLVALGTSMFIDGSLYQMLSGSEARERSN